VEAGAVDDHVGFVLDTRGVDDAVLADLPYAVGDDVDVVPRQRRVVVVGDEHALAAHRVVRGDLAAQRRVLDCAVDVAFGQALPELHHPRLAVEADRPGLEQPVQQGAVGALGRRERLEQRAGAPGHLVVGLRHDPRRRALEQRQLRGPGRDARHELDRAGAGADHRDLLAGEVDVVAPPRGVERRAVEPLDPGQLRDLRQVQRADPGDQRVTPPGSCYPSSILLGVGYRR
jgi:hypothetical protein